MPRIPLTPISVDDFSYAPGVTIFLLTHLHTDHLKGLSPSWDKGYIYGSGLTLRLLRLRMAGIDESRLVEIEEGTQKIIPLDEAGHIQVAITCLEVGHCLGAVMFLLRGYFGSILCTGDFRYSASELQGIPELQTNLIDDLYLDDTFLDPKHDFPNWEIAGQQIIDFVATSKADQILIRVDLWGKEELLAKLAKRFQTLVVVSQERYQMLVVAIEMGLLPPIFTTDPSQGKIHAVSYKPKEENLLYKSKTMNMTFVAVIPSGWVGTEPVFSKNKKVLRVGYSAHSSFSELLSFTSWLRPRAIHGISRHDSNVAVNRYLSKFLRDPGNPVSLLQRLDHGRLIPNHVLLTLTKNMNPNRTRRGGALKRNAAVASTGGILKARRRGGVQLRTSVSVTQDDAIEPGTPPSQITIKANEHTPMTNISSPAGRTPGSESGDHLFASDNSDCDEPNTAEHVVSLLCTQSATENEPRATSLDSVNTLDSIDQGVSLPPLPPNRIPGLPDSLQFVDKPSQLSSRGSQQDILKTPPALKDSEFGGAYSILTGMADKAVKNNDTAWSRTEEGAPPNRAVVPEQEVKAPALSAVQENLLLRLTSVDSDDERLEDSLLNELRQRDNFSWRPPTPPKPRKAPNR
eukprot:TRINITY_DN18547_c0_g1_i1.p1 TRINITY_DN18547_c0_g1~~TRINITY_DN18547_c0_g1_i1.p1  ORF type:complete len:630 (+),score=87.57 TRINITY_DN18547_c0_g1_i1:66-1955(+)